MTLTRRIHLATIALAALTFSMGIASRRGPPPPGRLAPTGAILTRAAAPAAHAKRKKGALRDSLVMKKVGRAGSSSRSTVSAWVRSRPTAAEGHVPASGTSSPAQGGTVVAGATSCLPNPCAGATPVDDDGDIVCCLPDDSGPECEDRTTAECAAAGGIDLGPGSCLPNPCSGGPASDDVVCCLPDDSGPECEDRTAAQCASEGGVHVDGASCAAGTCAPTAPPDGDVRCCLPGDSGPECEDRTAAARRWRRRQPWRGSAFRIRVSAAL
jgi:hypothetical protein